MITGDKCVVPAHALLAGKPVVLLLSKIHGQLFVGGSMLSDLRAGWHYSCPG
jgi:hypothetical protein